MKVTAQGTEIKRKSKMHFTIVALLLFFNSLHLFSISFKEALAVEREGKVAEAIEAYKMLIANGDLNYCEIVSRLVVLVSNLDEKRSFLKDGLGACKEPETLHAFYLSLAGIDEITGNLESAQKYYQSASLTIPGKKDFSSLLSSAVLLFELGDYRGAEAQATVIIETCRIDELVSGAELLLSRTFFATDREDKSLQIAFDLLKKDPITLQPAALLWIVELSSYLEKNDLKKRAIEILLTSFPDTPEAAIYSGEIGRVPSPSLFFGLRQAKIGLSAEEIAVENEAADSEKTIVLSIQTGSYSVRDNAEYALKDLEKEGFTAEIKERKVGDSVYYRVLIVDVNSENVDKVILELKEKGFEGFRVYE